MIDGACGATVPSFSLTLLVLPLPVRRALRTDAVTGPILVGVCLEDATFTGWCWLCCFKSVSAGVVVGHEDEAFANDANDVS